MKKVLCAGLAAGLLMLTACGGTAEPSNEPAGGASAEPAAGTLTIAATTYPVYCFATAVVEGVEGVTVEAVINQSISCLHDYTLTVNDMKSLEGADLVLLSGAGLEDFMDSALAGRTGGSVIDCSEAITLLPGEYAGEADPHIWMDPARAAQMVDTIARNLAQLDPDHAAQYEANASAAGQTLAEAAVAWQAELSGLSCREIITFHDGFAYFAEAFDLEVLAAIEEEEGSEASAQEITALIALIGEHQLPVVFTEVNGSDATANTIARETGVAVRSMTMIMSGEDSGLTGYLDGISYNVTALAETMQ